MSFQQRVDEVLKNHRGFTGFTRQETYTRGQFVYIISNDETGNLKGPYNIMSVPSKGSDEYALQKVDSSDAVISVAASRIRVNVVNDVTLVDGAMKSITLSELFHKIQDAFLVFLFGSRELTKDEVLSVCAIFVIFLLFVKAFVNESLPVQKPVQSSVTPAHSEMQTLRILAQSPSTDK